MKHVNGLVKSGKDWLAHVTGTESGTSDTSVAQRESTADEVSRHPANQDQQVNDELFDIDPRRYMSSGSAGRGGFDRAAGAGETLEHRRQNFRRSQGETTSPHFNVERTPSAVRRRSEREANLLRGSSGTVGTALRIPSNGMPAQFLKKKPIAGGPQPRNDLAKGPRAIHARNSNGSLRNGSQSFAAAKRKNVEGDGWERQQINTQPEERSRPAETETKLRMLAGVRKRQNLGTMQESAAAAQEPEEIEDDDEVREIPPVRQNDAKRSRETSATPHRSVKRPRLDSERDSPDPLASAIGPDGDYQSVAHVPNKPSAPQRAVHQTKVTFEGKKPTNGLRLKQVRFKEQAWDGPHLYLVPHLPGQVYKVFLNGDELDFTLRLKDIYCGMYHMNSPVVIIECSPTPYGFQQFILEFASEKDRTKFYTDVLSHLKDPDLFKPARNPRQLANIYRAIVDQGHSLRTMIPGTSNSGHPSGLSDVNQDGTINRLTRPSAKLKDGMSGPDKPITNDIIEDMGERASSIRSLPQRTDAYVRRSGRHQTQPERLGMVPAAGAEELSRPKIPSPPPLEKYSVKVGLPRRWKHPLIYPSTGKNRATVSHDDLFKLDEGELLNDNLVNFYLRYLEETLKEQQPEISNQVYWFNTYFFTTITSGKKSSKDINYDAVKKWTRNVDLFSFDYLVVPIVENYHWYLAIIANLSSLRDGTWHGLQAENDDSKVQALFNNDVAAQTEEPTVNNAQLSTEAKCASRPAENDAKLPVEMPGSSCTGAVTPRADKGVARNESLREASVSQPEQVHDPNLQDQPMPRNEQSVDDIFSALDDDEAVPEESVLLSSRAPSRASDAGREIANDSATNLLLSHLEQHLDGEDALESGKKAPSKEGFTVPKDQEVLLLEVPSQALTESQESKSSKRKKLKHKPPVRRYDENQTAIITLDSLGLVHTAAIRALKLYLIAEAKEKRDGWELDIKEFEGVKGVGIPEQNNFCDCGLYLLGYAEKFCKDPKQVVTKLLHKSLNAETDWPELRASDMRNALRELLFKEHDEQNTTRKAGKEARREANQRKSSHSLLQSASELRKSSDHIASLTIDKNTPGQDLDAVQNGSVSRELRDIVTTSDLPQPRLSADVSPTDDQHAKSGSRVARTRDEEFESAQTLIDDKEHPSQVINENDVPLAPETNSAEPDEQSFRMVHSSTIPSQTFRILIPSSSSSRKETAAEIPETPQSSPPPPNPVSSRHFPIFEQHDSRSSERLRTSREGSATYSKGGLARPRRSKGSDTPAATAPGEVIELD